MSVERNHSDDMAEDLRAVVPYRFVGLGLWTIWGWAMHTRHLLDVSVADDSILPLGANLTLTVFNSFFLLILALFFRRIGSVSRRPMLVSSGYAALILTTLLSILLVQGVASNVFTQWARAILGGFGSAVLVLAWAEVYSRLGVGRVFLYGSLSLVAAALVIAVIENLIAPYNTLAIIAVTLLSFPLCRQSIRYVGSEEVAKRERVSYPFPFKPVIIVAVAGFMANFINFVILSVSIDLHVHAIFVMGVVFLVILWTFGSRVKPVVLVGIAFVAIVVGFLLLALFDVGTSVYAAGFVMIGYTAISFFVFSMLADISYRYAVPSIWLFGLALATRDLMSHGAGFINKAMPFVSDLLNSPFHTAAVSVIGLVMLLLLAVLWHFEHGARISWSLGGIDVDEGHHTLSSHELLLYQSQAATKKYNLTAREQEVLVALLEGQSYQEICSGLFLSMNTVKSHVYHTYSKLGVHNRAEAAELVSRLG